MSHALRAVARIVLPAALILGALPGSSHAQPRWEAVNLAEWQACHAAGRCRGIPLPGTFEETTARVVVGRSWTAAPDAAWAGHPEYGGAFPRHTWIPRPHCARADGGFSHYPAGSWRLLIVVATVWNGGAWSEVGVASGWGFLSDPDEECSGTWVIPAWETDPPPWHHPIDPPPGHACANDLSDGMIPGVPLRLLVRDPSGTMTPVDAPYWVTHGPINPPPGGPPYRAIYPNHRPWAQGGGGSERLAAPQRVRVVVPPGGQLVAEYDFPRTRFADVAARWVTVGAHNDPRNMALVIQDLGPDRAYATPDDRFLFAQFFHSGLPEETDDLGASRFGPLRWLAWRERGVALANVKVLNPVEDWPAADLYGMSSGSSYERFRFLHDAQLTFLDPPAFCRDGTSCDAAGRLRRPEPGNPFAHNLLEGVMLRDPSHPEAGYVFAPVAPLRIAFPVQAGRSYRVGAFTSVERCRTHPGNADHAPGNVFHWFSNATQIMVDVADGGVIRGAVLDVTTGAPRAADAGVHRVALIGRVYGQEVWLDEQPTDRQARFAVTARLDPLLAALAAQGRSGDDATPVTLRLRLTTLGQPTASHALRYAPARDYPAQPPRGQTGTARTSDQVEWTASLGALRSAAQEEAAFFVVQVPPFTPPTTDAALALLFRAADGDGDAVRTYATLERSPSAQLDWFYGATLTWRPTLTLRLPDVWETAGYRLHWSLTRWTLRAAGGRPVGASLGAAEWHRLAVGRAGWRPPDGALGIWTPQVDGTPVALEVGIDYTYWIETPWGEASAESAARFDGTARLVIHAARLRPEGGGAQE